MGVVVVVRVHIRIQNIQMIISKSWAVGSLKVDRSHPSIAESPVVIFTRQKYQFLPNSFVLYQYPTLERATQTSEVPFSGRFSLGKEQYGTAEQNLSMPKNTYREAPTRTELSLN